MFMRTATVIVAGAIVAFSSSAKAQIATSAKQANPVSDSQSKKRNGGYRPEPLVLVDATGKIVGAFFPPGGVILNIQGVLIPANVTNQINLVAPFTDSGVQSATKYRWAIAGTTNFLTSNCSGPPVPLASGGLRPVAYTQDLATGVLTAYIGGSGLSVPKFTSSSTLSTLGNGPFSGRCTSGVPAQGGNIQGFDVEQTANISQRYPEPLTVK